jgi:threonine aldolase
MPIIDLRSDTFTLPTPAMREAMYRAEVGDDVFGEDPTVNRLEELAAERLGKESAVFVASGTMGNIACLLSHCGRGDEMILGDQSHIYIYEQGGSAALGGIHPRPLPNETDGTIDLDAMEAAVRGPNQHFPRTRLICLENTHNRCGGPVLTPQYMQDVGQLARQHGLRLHLDGARLFNAAVALGVEARVLVQEVDSVTFCLSKGLGAPVGSVICGSREFIAEARRARKVLGGGWRQAGVIAASGIVALEQMVDRLAEDHANAKRLAGGLVTLPGIVLDLARVQSDIVIFELQREDMTPAELATGLRERGVRLNPIGGRRLRAVTNYHVTAEDIDRALQAFGDVLD